MSVILIFSGCSTNTQSSSQDGLVASIEHSERSRTDYVDKSVTTSEDTDSQNPWDDAEPIYTVNSECSELSLLAEDVFKQYVSETYMGENTNKDELIYSIDITNIQLWGDTKEFAAEFTFDAEAEGSCPIVTGGQGGVLEDGIFKGNTAIIRVRMTGDNKYGILTLGGGATALGLSPVEKD